MRADWFWLHWYSSHFLSPPGAEGRSFLGARTRSSDCPGRFTMAFVRDALNGLRGSSSSPCPPPVVSTMIAYNVGSCDEDLDNTGLRITSNTSLFKGTEKLPGDYRSPRNRTADRTTPTLRKT